MSAMRRIFGDPLVHFLLIGGCLFALLAWRSEESDPRVITLSAVQVRTALQTAMPGAQYPTTQAELDAFIQPLIRDEVFYREALALGLDVDDDQVRTRLIEKMSYVSEDLADPEPGSDAELREFFATNPERFALPETVTFDHVFFSIRQRGDDALPDATASLAALRRGENPSAQGDATPLGQEFREAARDRLEILFGTELTDLLFTAEIAQWNGPLESEFGLHLFRVISRRATRQPEYEEVQDEVREAFAADRRARRNEEVWERLRERYEVVVEWPAEFRPGD